MDHQEVGGSCGDRMELAQNRDRWRALMSRVRNLLLPKMQGISWLAVEPGSFSRRTLLHGGSKKVCLWLTLRPFQFLRLQVVDDDEIRSVWKESVVAWYCYHLEVLFRELKKPLKIFSHNIRVSRKGYKPTSCVNCRRSAAVRPCLIIK